MILFGNEEHGHAISVASGGMLNPTDVVISRESDGKLLGGVIFSNYTQRTISIHVAGFVPNWINNDLLWVVFDYPFNQLGCESILGQIRQSNHKSLAFTRKMGFIELVRVPDIFPDGDLIVTRLLRSQCRWLDLKPRTIQRLTLGKAEAAAPA